MKLGEVASSLQPMLQNQIETNRPTVGRVKSEAATLIKAVHEVEDSSSGSNFGYHAELYYGEFQRPPRRFNVEWGGINGCSPVGV
jgi:hypothetical protein